MWLPYRTSRKTKSRGNSPGVGWRGQWTWLQWEDYFCESWRIQEPAWRDQSLSPHPGSPWSCSGQVMFFESWINILDGAQHIWQELSSAIYLPATASILIMYIYPKHFNSRILTDKQHRTRTLPGSPQLPALWLPRQAHLSAPSPNTGQHCHAHTKHNVR